VVKCLSSAVISTRSPGHHGTAGACRPGNGIATGIYVLHRSRKAEVLTNIIGKSRSQLHIGMPSPGMSLRHDGCGNGRLDNIGLSLRRSASWIRTRWRRPTTSIRRFATPLKSFRFCGKITGGRHHCLCWNASWDHCPRCIDTSGQGIPAIMSQPGMGKNVYKERRQRPWSDSLSAGIITMIR